MSHWLDLLSVYPTRKRSFFPHGLGEPQMLQQVDEFLRSLVREPHAALLPAQQATVSTLHTSKTATHVELRFPSVCRQFLPEHAKEARALLVLRSEWCVDNTLASLNDVRRAVDNAASVAVHMPMSGDAGYAFRLKSYGTPLLVHDVCSIILEAPYYGARRNVALLPKPNEYVLPTTAALGAQAAGIVSESIALINFFGANKSTALCGVSYGGAMATLAGTIARNYATVTVSTVGCVSPASPFIDGLLNAAVFWPTVQADRDAVEKALHGFSLEIVVKEALQLRDQQPTAEREAATMRYVHQFARNDLIVTKDSSKQQLAEMQRLLGASQCQKRALWGGHGTAVYAQSAKHVDAIAKGLKGHQL